MANLLTYLYDNLPKNNSKDVLLVKQNGRYQGISYAEIINLSEAFHFALRNRGIGPDDKVAILSANSPEWIVADIATLSLEGVSVPIYESMTPDSIQFILNDSGAKAIVLDSKKQLEKVLAVKAALPKLEKIICTHWDTLSDDLKTTCDNFYTYIHEGRQTPVKEWEAHRKRALEIDPDRLITIIYTSGTTGQHKGVMLTHNNVIANCESCLPLIGITPLDRSLSFLPFSHIFARSCEYYLALKVGSTLALAESVDKIPQNLQEIKPTLFYSVPRLYEKIYSKIRQSIDDGPVLKRLLFNWALSVGERYRFDHDNSLSTRIQLVIADRLIYAKIRQRLGGNIRLMFTGGGPISKEIQEFFYKLGLLIIEGYGLTETSPVIAINRPDDFKFGTVGKPPYNVQLKIDADGEILAKGPNVMQGYYNNDAATRESFTEDGWFRTGDVGEFDNDGFLKITDRKKDLFILTSGKNVAPQFVENKIKLNPYVSQVALIGHQRHYVSALIVPEFENLKTFAIAHNIDAPTIDDLIAHPEIMKLFNEIVSGVNNELARYEQVKQFRLLPSEFSVESGELTPTLKVKRKVVDEKYHAIIESLYHQELR